MEPTADIVLVVLGLFVLVTLARLGLRLLFFLASLAVVVLAVAWLAGYPPGQVLPALGLS